MAGDSATTHDALLDAVFGAAGAALCLVDSNGRVVRSNTDWQRWTSAADPGVVRAALEQVHRRPERVVPIARHELRAEAWEGRIDPVPFGGGRAYLLSVRPSPRSAEPPPSRGDTVYRLAFENVRDLVAVLEAERDASGVIVDWIYREANGQNLEVFGLTRETMLSTRLSELYPDGAARVSEMWSRVVATGQPCEYEASFKSAEFIVRIFRIDANTIVSTSLDITSRKRTEQRLAAEREYLVDVERRLESSRAELLELIEKLPIGIFVSRAGKVIYANHAFTQLLGYDSPGEIVGMGPEEMLVADEHEAGRAYVQSADRPTRALPGREWRVRRRDGQVVTIESSGTREIELDGKQSVLWTVRDLTELRVMQAKLMQSDRLASVGLLAGGVGHEINNPLAFMTAAIEFVDETLRELAPLIPAPQLREVTQALVEARAGSARVKHVVNELKSFSRADAETRTELNLEKVLDTSVSMAAFEIKHRARLVCDYGVAPLVLADEGRLGQVFLNLLINAAHAIREGAADANEIRVVTSTDDVGRAVVEVHDTGSGIRHDLASRVFDPFFTTKPMGVGTGLGLSICRNVVHGLGGEITFETEQGKGTVFRVRLPPARAASVVRREPARIDTAEKARRGRVLVVDDELSVGNALRRILAGEHDVVALTSARDAHDRIKAGERFDVIVCDLMMPEMTGMDLHAALQSGAPDQASRMVFLTGGAFTDKAKAFLTSVTNPQMEKPFDTSALRALVRARVQKV